jgi:hypothetical protein
MMHERSGTYHYRLFGGVLNSDIVIPELDPIEPETPTWTLRSREGEPPGADGTELGTDRVTGEVQARMYRRDTGLRLIFDDTGCFDIGEGGRSIEWVHAPEVSIDDARTDLTSRVLAAALHEAGTTCLHGSAVVIGDEAIGFVAPKFHGKSTLALALVRAGARLLTDDTLPVMPGPQPRACPGVHATRLWADSAERVGIGGEGWESTGSKLLFRSLPDEYVSHSTHPLAALYLLSPAREPSEGRMAWRTRLPTMEATLVMIGHAKLAPLLSGPEAPRLFRQAAALAAVVPVYRLGIARDLDRIEEVAATILSWHGSVPAGALP